jgi:CIC family chloride channel protein
MLSPILTGIIAAVAVFLPRYFFSKVFELSWSYPILILGVGAAAMILQKYVIERREGSPIYGGIADLIFHIHTPSSHDSSIRWVTRGFTSFLLTCFGSAVGPEGAATELAHAFNVKIRPRASTWFEQKRRTDVSCSLAAAVSAGFGAPFAGVLLPIEIGIGGKSISSAVSALTAFILSWLLQSYFSLDTFDISGILAGLQVNHLNQWFSILILGVFAGIASVLLIHFIQYCQESLKNLFQTQVWMRILSGAILLALVFYIDRPLRDFHWKVFEQILWLKFNPGVVLLIFATQFLSLSIVLSSFGSVGVFWPLLVIGGSLGFSFDYWVLRDFLDSSSLAGVVLAASLCGATMGAPIASSLIIFELTHNIQILLPCFIASLLAQQVRKWMKTESLMSRDLINRGLILVHGRSLDVLNSISIRESMVTDFEIVHEQEPLVELKGRVLKSKYPFLPVVNSQGAYSGLLTIDMLQEEWEAKENSLTSAQLPLASILEVKDLLYRSSYKSPVVKLGDRLSHVMELFDDAPCVPVLSEDRRVLGLLFVSNIRLVYDREIARQAFTFGH